MIYPDVSIEKWLQLYPDLKSAPETCDCCQRSLSFTIPFVSKDWVGIKSADCPCGEMGEAVIQIPRTKNSKQRWGSVYNVLWESK